MPRQKKPVTDPLAKTAGAPRERPLRELPDPVDPRPVENPDPEAFEKAPEPRFNGNPVTDPLAPAPVWSALDLATGAVAGLVPPPHQGFLTAVVNATNRPLGPRLLRSGTLTVRAYPQIADQPLAVKVLDVVSYQVGRFVGFSSVDRPDAAELVFGADAGSPCRVVFEYAPATNERVAPRAGIGQSTGTMPNPDPPRDITRVTPPDLQGLTGPPEIPGPLAGFEGDLGSLRTDLIDLLATGAFRDDFHAAHRLLGAAGEMFRGQVLAPAIEPGFNSFLARLPRDSYQEKRVLCKWVNSALADLGLAVDLPAAEKEALRDKGNPVATGAALPCRLLAGTGGDKTRGRFEYEIELDGAHLRICRPNLPEHLALVAARPDRRPGRGDVEHLISPSPVPDE